MKSILFVFITTFLTISAGIAQNFSSGQTSNDLRRDLSQGGSIWVSTRSKNTNIEGSVYLFSSWVNVSTVYMKEASYQIQNLNYNIDKDQLEAKFAEDSVLVLNSQEVLRVKIYNVELAQYYNAEKKKRGFFQTVVDTGEFMLLKQYSVSIKEGTFNPMTQQRTKPDEYVKHEEYFIKRKEQEGLKAIKLRKSVILELVGSKGDQIKAYVKDNNLRYNNDFDISKILTYYNSLSI
ncbi:hypothetical protein [Mangrovimonas xylaniphaga]|uniref:hypothetical protein n=1 Tax=Mangrovimonas xylaniphaga TaxID=1645915 RepID=UPI0006B442B5|nr:hypothetical protein [Mangrovimonas xylaniphaga]